jgi:hypothetical protein
MNTEEIGPGSIDEPSPLGSKKFVAYLVADLGWTVLMGYGVYAKMDWSLLMTMVITKGFVQSGYILGQAALDKYVRVAQITSGIKEGE